MSAGQPSAARIIVDGLALEHLSKFLELSAWHRAVGSNDVGKRCTNECLDEFWFCLLGGYSVTYELNANAFRALSMDPGLSEATLLSPCFIQRASESLRAIPVRTRTGMRNISYRFPNSKAKALFRAAAWLTEERMWNLVSLYEYSPCDARIFLMKCPGFGLKTASWFLRNIGHGYGLAIIDVHVARLASRWHLVPDGLDPVKDYLEIENRLKSHCSKCDVDISEIDLALWRYSRGDLINHESGQWRLF